MSLDTWIGSLEILEWNDSGNSDADTDQRTGFIIVVKNFEPDEVRALLTDHLPEWAIETALASGAEFQVFHGKLGPLWLLRQMEAESAAPLSKSNFARFRDLGGSVVPQLSQFKLDCLVLEMHSLTRDEEKALLVGLEMARYNYVENRDNPLKTKKRLPDLQVWVHSEDFNLDVVLEAQRLALSVNIARHFVNLPGGELNPTTYADAAKKLFLSSESVAVDIWDETRLLQERMNLMLAVGQGASEKPCLIHLRYRPRKSVLPRPIAIVGKGITFDSGGLDIKPSNGMRWMKKDMGGSAAAIAIAKWAELTALPVALDIYLAVAENAISGNSFRPGDVITARNGLTIEIHNTDAEGRLVLADALDVAVTQTGRDEPAAVIDIATLTGAIKVGLGGEIAGLFSNHDGLAEELEDAGQACGDLSWRMPLYAPYKSALRSTFADYANTADGFGGAITAALFLEFFIKGKPWVHLDVYAWKDSAGGAWSEAGGSGQPVFALTELLSRFANGHVPADLLETSNNPSANSLIEKSGKKSGKNSGKKPAKRSAKSSPKKTTSKSIQKSKRGEM